MQPTPDLKRYAILYVDDEEKALKYFVRTFSDEFRFMTALNAAEGLQLLEKHGDEIGILITDQRMPGEKGVQLLERAYRMRPNLIRILTTAYAEFGVTVDAVNFGRIFRYIAKPVDVEDVRNTLHIAMAYYTAQQERDGLLREKLSVVQNMLVMDRVMALGVLGSSLRSRLRRPLTGLRGFFDLIPEQQRREAMNVGWMRDTTFWLALRDHTEAQCDQIAAILAEAGAVVGPVSAQDARALLQSELDQLAPLMSAKGVSLQFQATQPSASMQVHESVFRQFARLLLHAHLELLERGSKGVVQGFVSADGAELRLILSDDGPGITAGSLQAVFDPMSVTQGPQAAGGIFLLGVCLLAAHLGGGVRRAVGVGGVAVEVWLPLSYADAVAEDSDREFMKSVLVNDALWERLMPPTMPG